MLSDEQYALPAAVGRLFDHTILTGDVLRPVAGDWRCVSERNLLRAASGVIVRPLRATADKQRVVAVLVEQPVSEIVDRDGANSSSLRRVTRTDVSPPGSDAKP